MSRIVLVLLSYLVVSTALGASADFDAAFKQGSEYLKQGRYPFGLQSLETAQTLAETPAQQAKALGWLGLTYYRMHRIKDAAGLLQSAIGLEAADAGDRARWTAALADLEAGKGRRDAARRLYADALNVAGNDAALSAAIRLGQTKLQPQHERLSQLLAIYRDVQGIEPIETRAAYLVNLATQASALGGGSALARNGFEQAVQLSQAESRLQAEAMSGLAQQLWENDRHNNDALSLNREAKRIAENNSARDLLMDIEWREGRMQEDLQQSEAALAAYLRAVDHLESIRRDIPVEYDEGVSSFEKNFRPRYLKLADLLLKQSGSNSISGAEKTQLLRRARNTIELIKRSELDDFLGSRCAMQTVRETSLDQRMFDPGKHTDSEKKSTSAVVYPILLDDRLEILVSKGNQIRRFTQQVSKASIAQSVKDTVQALRANRPEARDLSRRLHDWLITPLEFWLRETAVDTLVIVPDAVLRTLPLAALYDGEHYLIEKYALASSPGLTLGESAAMPDSATHEQVTALLAGVSEPGTLAENLPSVFFTAMAGTRSGAEQAGARLARDADYQRSVKQRLALKGVKEELGNLAGQPGMKSDKLENAAFSAANFERQLLSKPYAIVHIASHGVFGHSAATSFIMASDRIIDMDELQRLFSADKFKQHPVELLVLSACLTAAGDDRAPLGLSGVAIKTKVKSAVGSLWPVSDAATPELMSRFYRHLNNPALSKAKALQSAQRDMLKDARFSHPYYWAAFILVGDWL
ncbi:MAG: CHAT domain-containing protein [Methylococcales bacterium]